MKLAELFVQFSTQGQDTLHAALGALENEFAQVQDAAQKVGGYLGGQFQAAQKLVTDGLNAKMKPAIEQATNGLVKMLAAQRGITEDQARAMVQWEVSRAKVEEYGKAVAHWVGDIAQGAVQLATASITGLVAQGISLSAEGQVMSARFQQLSLSVAGLFGPEIRAVSQWIQDLTDWIRSLTDEQKDSIVWWIKLTAALGMAAIGFKGLFGSINAVLLVAVTLSEVTGELNFKWLAVGVAIAGIVSIVPSVVRGVMAIVAAVRAFNVQAVIARILAGDWKTALMAVAAGVVAAGAIYGISKIMEPDVDKNGKPKGGKSGRGQRGQLARAVGGPEDITAAFSRVNTAFLNATAGIGKTPAEVTNDKLDETNKKLDGIHQALGGQQPIVRR